MECSTEVGGEDGEGEGEGVSTMGKVRLESAVPSSIGQDGTKRARTQDYSLKLGHTVTK